MRKSKKPYWTNKEGQEIPIENMDDTYLLNTIHFLTRRHKEECDISFPVFNGEMAQYYAQQEYNRITGTKIYEMFPVFNDLIREKTKRKL